MFRCLDRPDARYYCSRECQGELAKQLANHVLDSMHCIAAQDWKTKHRLDHNSKK